MNEELRELIAASFGISADQLRHRAPSSEDEALRHREKCMQDLQIPLREFSNVVSAAYAALMGKRT
jgi:hypothetical protein